MAMIAIYKNNPTEGGTDGTAVSQNGAQTSPISAVLNATISDEAVITLAIRADAGFQTSGDTTFSFTGTTAAKWSICATADGSFSDTLTISETIGDTNTLFYVKASTDATEEPSNDTSVVLVVEGLLVVAS